jgi:adenylate cyclase
MVGLFSAAVVLTLRATGILQPLDLDVYDLLIQWQARDQSADPRITVISIVEDDIHQQGQWPISDYVLSEVLKRLKMGGARAIGIDIYRDIEVPPGRPLLDDVLKSTPQIVTVTKLGGAGTPTIPAPPVLRGTEQFGFNDILVDPDGIVRRGLLFQDAGDQVAFGFALRLALLFLQHEGITPQSAEDETQSLRLGTVTLPPFESTDGGYVGADANGYQVLLDYQGGSNGFRTFSLTQLLNGQVPPEAVKEKVVLIGVGAESVPDWFHTPLSSVLQPGEIMTGVTLHGHLVSQLLRAGLEGQRGKRTLSEIQEAGVTIVVAILGGLIGMRLRSPWRYAGWVVGGLGVMSGGGVALFRLGWWVPTVPPALAWLLSSSLTTVSVLKREKKERASLMRLFEQHVSPQVADTIWRDREHFLEGGRPRPQKMMVTVLFSDFKGYTAAAEKLDPHDLMEWINSYIEAMAHVVTIHGGVVDDYAGDGIKANFGVPLPNTDETAVRRSAVAAVICSLAMQEQLQRLNTQWRERGRDSVGMRIGISTGFVVAGTIGSSQRLKYTTVGDTVNAAARLESLDRDHVPVGTVTNPCRILIDGKTRSYLGDDIAVESIGAVSVKGKREPLETYRVIARTTPAPTDDTALRTSECV